MGNYRTLKAGEARKLIGQRVTWIDEADVVNGYVNPAPRFGTLTDVRGKNAEVCGDWLWLPKLLGLRSVKS